MSVLIGWRNGFDYEMLLKAKNMYVEIISQNETEIIVEVAGRYDVSVLLFHGTPYIMKCNCDSMGNCIHEAAAYMFFEKNLDLFENVSSKEIPSILQTATREELIDFLINESKSNQSLKYSISQVFGRNMDELRYSRKLKNIINEGRDFNSELEVIYDLDLIKDSIIVFFNHDLIRILRYGRYEFASELLCMVGDILMLEESLNYESWNDLAEAFVEFSTPLKVSLMICGLGKSNLIKVEEYINNILY